MRFCCCPETVNSTPIICDEDNNYCHNFLLLHENNISLFCVVCVSSIVPADFVAAVAAGADMIEIGNFDGFYEQGLKFTAEDVIKMTIDTRR